ncbi:MAG: tetratricopeptide repeat protein [Phycisphaerae bacterium]|nr:tetratricopeptide repeat protein [Phycisphaerae bacterium]
MLYQFKRALLRGGFFRAMGALLIGAGAPALGQTTQTTRPQRLTHAERLQEAARAPILRGQYRSAGGEPLTDAEKAEIDESDGLMEKATRLREQVDYPAALAAAQEALAIRHRILGNRHHLTATAALTVRILNEYAGASEVNREKLAEADKQFALAEESYLRGRYAEAEEAAKRAVETRERILGKNHPMVGVALRVLGSAQMELRDFDASSSSLERALEIVESAYGKGHPQTALVLDRLGWLRLHQAAERGFPQKEVDEAAENLRRAMKVFKFTLGETRETAEAQDNLGTVQLYTGERKEALENKLRSLVIREAVLGPEDRDTGVSLSNLAWLYDQLGGGDEVIPLRRRALAVFRHALGPDHPYTTSELLNLAGDYQQREMWGETIELLEGFVPTDEKQPEKVVGSMVEGTARLSVAYVETGRQEDAARTIDRAFELATSLYEAGETRVAIVELDRLAGMFEGRRMLEDSIRALELLRTWDQKGGGDPNLTTLRRAMQLGSHYIDVGRLPEAKRILTEVLEQSEKLHGKDERELFSPLLLLSQAHEKMGELPAAEGLCDRALQISEKKLAEGSTRRAYAMVAMGRILMLQKKFDLAKFFLGEARAIAEKHEKRDPMTMILVVRDLAELHEALGEKAETTKLCRDAVERSREIAARVHGAGVNALLAKHIKLLLDALEAEGPAAKGECGALRSELKTLLEKLRAARALDAENKQWLKELGG